MFTPKIIHLFLHVGIAIACSPEFNNLDMVEDNPIDKSGSFVIPGLTMHQSMAFHDGEACFITPKGDNLTCDIYNLETKSKEASIILSHDGYVVPHANVSCFGNQFYSKDSRFPVLFVSAWDGGRQVFVYDIYLKGEEYYSRLVQIIDPALLNKNYTGHGQMDWIVDVDHDMIYSVAYGLSNSPYIFENNRTHICQFILPAIDDNITVYLEDKDLVNSFTLPVMTVFQDKCYSNGHIYVVAGIPDDENLYPPRLFDIDIAEQSLKEMRLSIKGEPEGFCFYQGVMWLNMFSSTTIYNIEELIN